MILARDICGNLLWLLPCVGCSYRQLYSYMRASNTDMPSQTGKDISRAMLMSDAFEDSSLSSDNVSEGDLCLPACRRCTATVIN